MPSNGWIGSPSLLVTATRRTRRLRADHLGMIPHPETIRRGISAGPHPLLLRLKHFKCPLSIHPVLCSEKYSKERQSKNRPP